MARFMFLLAPALLAAGTAQAAPPQWRVSETAGEVRIVEQGRARAAVRGALLSSGATVATGAAGRAVLVRGGQFVVVSPESQVRVPDPAQARGGIVQMLTDLGTALFRIDRRDTPHFGVDTPYLAAVVKGTTFTVTVGAAGASVQVTEGAVEVSTVDGGAFELLRPGMVASVAAGDRYQLNVDGDGSRAIRSPNAPAASVTGPAPALRAEPAAVIAGPVGERGVSLSDLTGGLLDGSTGIDIALAATADVRRAEKGGPGGRPAAPPAPNPAKPDTPGGKPDSNPGGDGTGGGIPGGGKPDDFPGGGNPTESPPGGGARDGGPR